MRFLLSFILCLLASLFNACNVSSGTIDTPVASVGDDVLMRSQLCSAMSAYSNLEDSAVIADEYVRRWINQQVMLHKAEMNLSDDELDINEAIEEYRRALLVEKYQQKLIEQKFKPQITDKEIEDYYESMKQNFNLNESIMKGVFAVVPKNAPCVTDMRKWLMFKEDDDYSNVEQFLYSYSRNYTLSLDKWIPISSVKRFLPLESQPTDIQISSHKVFEIEDDENVYYLVAIDTYMVDEVAPIEYVKEKIYNIILNKKKIDYIKQLSTALYNAAIMNNEIKFYTND